MRRISTSTTGIEWTDHTWNPFAGCNIYSVGWASCYAGRQARRLEEFSTAPHYRGLTKIQNGKAVWTGEVHRGSNKLMRKPLSIKGAALIFVNSMSDFFHPHVQDDWRLEAIDIMRQCPQHQFQVLTNCFFKVRSRRDAI